MQTMVKCRCGRRIVAREVLQTGLYVRSNAQSYVYVKYRCSRCKQLGEQMIDEQDWDWSVLNEEKNEMSEQERREFAVVSRITADEILDFHRELQRVEHVEDQMFRRKRKIRRTQPT